MGIKIGIDLGTDSSILAMMDERMGQPAHISTLMGEKSIPSVICFTEDGEEIVGSEANDMWKYGESDCVRVFDLNLEEQDPCCAFFGKQYTPEDLCAILLRHLKKEAEDSTGQTVDEAVVAIPFHFHSRACYTIMAAARKIGLNITQFINAPAVAALYYAAYHPEENARILIYDLSCRSFQAVVANRTTTNGLFGEQFPQFKLVGVSGDDRLGSWDWEALMFDHILNTCCEENGLFPEDIDDETRLVIRNRAQFAVKKLICSESARVKIAVNGSLTAVCITREEFETMTSHLVAETMSHVEDVLKQTGSADIDAVLLVGGFTGMPVIRKALDTRFPGKVRVHEPDFAVAKGAAVYADILSMMNHSGTDVQEQPSIGKEKERSV